jgi:thioredoxin-related protein
MLKILIVSLILVNIYGEAINWSKTNLDKTIQSAKSKKQKIIMAYFWQKNCNACEYMTDRVFIDDNVSKFINENFIPYKTNKLTNDYFVFAFPAIYFIDENGDELAEPIMGARNLNDFKKIIKNIKDINLK